MRLFRWILTFFACAWYWLTVTPEEKRAAGVGNRDEDFYSIRPIQHANLNAQSTPDWDSEVLE